MLIQQTYIVANVLMALDAVILIATGYAAYLISLEVRLEGLVMAWQDFLGLVLFLMFVNNYFMGKFGFYSERRFSSTGTLLKSLFKAILWSFLVLSAAGILVGIQPFSRVFIFAYFFLSLFSIGISRLILNFYFEKRSPRAFNSRRLLLIGEKDRVEAVSAALATQRSWGHQVVGCLSVNGDCAVEKHGIQVLGGIEDFDRIMKEQGIDEVIFALAKGSPVELAPYLNKCDRTGVAVRIVPAMFEPSHPIMKVETIQTIPTLTYNTGSRVTASGLLYKRALDLIGGVLGVLLFLPLYPLIGLAIKLDSRGPVLFKQPRVARNGRIFHIYKFRSMVQDADAKKMELISKSEMNGPIFKMENDPRITRVGRFIRRTSLDEIPQFINVLKGEMSLVGTRPPTPDEVARYEDWHRRRISMKPGLTGLWQVSGRNKITDFNEVVKLDLRYIDQWRFWHDLVILFKTVQIVLARKGAK